MRCYWLKSPRPLISNSFDSSSSINNNGQNIQPLAEVLTQLCVGSLGHNVPPQDTLLALEGMLSLRDQHNLFSTNWFQSECWLSLFLPTLRAMVLRMHQIHHSALESVFIALLEAKLISIQNTFGLETPEGLNQARDFWMFVGQEVSENFLLNSFLFYLKSINSFLFLRLSISLMIINAQIQFMKSFLKYLQHPISLINLIQKDVWIS